MSGTVPDKDLLVPQRVKIRQAVYPKPEAKEDIGWGLLILDPIAPSSSILAWRIPWIEKPGGLQSMGSQRVRYNWVTNTHILKKKCPCIPTWDYKATVLQLKINNFLNVHILGLPLWPSGWDSTLPIQGAQFQSLIRELDPSCHK